MYAVISLVVCVSMMVVYSYRVYEYRVCVGLPCGLGLQIKSVQACECTMLVLSVGVSRHPITPTA